MNGVEQLRAWMNKKGLNMTETAAYLGWNLSFLSMVLSGIRRPNLTKAAQLEDEAGIPPKAWVLSPRSANRKRASSKGKKAQSLQAVNRNV